MDARRVVENLLDDPTDFVLESELPALRGTTAPAPKKQKAEKLPPLTPGYKRYSALDSYMDFEEGDMTDQEFHEKCERFNKVDPFDPSKETIRLWFVRNEWREWQDSHRLPESVAVDLDGTLAKDTGWKGTDHIGEPVPEMLQLVHNLLDDGEEVVIFTARVHDGKKSTEKYIRDWLKKHDLPDDLEITNEKRPDMEKFYDDKAVEVKKNKGLSGSVEDGRDEEKG